MADSPNPYLLLPRAASGELQAQRQLADIALNMSHAHGDPAALFDGLVFARLAAAHGDIEDHGRLIFMLAMAGRECRHDEQELMDALAGESLARTSILADQGVEETDNATATWPGKMTRRAVEVSKEIRAAMLEVAEGTQ